jgi:hypothetical protein
LAERRFLLQFQERAGAAGAPGLAADLLGLLGGAQVDAAALSKFLPEWEKAFSAATSRHKVHASIAAPRLAYYKMAFEAMLAGESPHSALWPMVHTWTLSAAVLPPTQQMKWQAACEILGLAGEVFNARLEGLDHFLDSLEELLENTAARHGL